ncbi:MAG: NAD(+) synthase [Chloroflexi bacterium RBG_13_57_8]|nr:MAG: NAD(+) synthase [Chloroflexi bacterium RBG_13_57_8]
MDKVERVRLLTAWIQDRVRAAGCRGVVFGLSGGIDSSVLAALCKKAFPQNTLGIIMPCYSIPEDKDHAEMVARKFEFPTKTVVLNAVYDALLYILPDLKPDEAVTRLARGNLKARLRMSTLYYISNQAHYLVAGSGNRSEISIGYFTKYGDGAADFFPLGNLVKKEVRELARYLEIPREIIDKPPSAGLWDGQTDEGEMGLTYEAIDRVLLTGTGPDELKSRIEFLKTASLHKKTTPAIPDF